MALMAVAFPILPGKTDEWRSFIAELNGARNAEFVASRKRAGVHEVTFLQPTPMGDLVIVTLEGDDPAKSFGMMSTGTDEFTTWFVERAKALHGVDISAPMTAAPSEQVLDTGKAAVTA